MFQSANFDRLLGTPGFSDSLLKNHFTLYEGYVKNINALLEKFQKMRAEGNAGTPEFAELRRRFGWEFNGMRLHELYFGNMAKGGATLEKGGKLERMMVESFGSADACLKEFRAIGAMRGIGWAALVCDPVSKLLFNIWINEHDAGHLAGSAPILVLDVFEHAYVADYGIKRADYIEAFFAAVDWNEALRRSETIA